MRRTFLFMLLFLSTFNLAKTQVIFEADFSKSGALNQFTQFDLDGLKPHYDNWGTNPPYSSWVILEDQAASTSWYDPAGRSNDWLVSKAIAIPQNAADYVIAWTAQSWDATYRDGYRVLISETGSHPANFTKEIFSTVAENTYPTTHTVSLAEYAGKSVYFAWVNDSDDKFILGISSIVVGKTAISLSPNITSYINAPNTLLRGTITNKLRPIKNFTVNVSTGDQTISETFVANLAAGEIQGFTMTSKIDIKAGETVSYEMWAVADDFETEKISGTVSRVTEVLPRKFVGEEATGTWCGWCPRGTVAMATMKQKYPENFIGIAVHNNDPMVVTAYDTGVSRAVGYSYPSGLFNRITVCDPSNFEETLNNKINEITPAKISLQAQFVDNTHASVKLSALVDFAVNLAIADFRIAFAITENHVRGTNEGYNQSNYYSGGDYGQMGGFEALPNPVPASQMIYEDVARAIVGGFDGFQGSLPASIKAGRQEHFEHTLTLPSNIQNFANVEIAALLIDNKSGEIINADRISAAEITDAKQLTLVYENRELIDGEAVTISEIDPDSGLMKFAVKVKNNGAEAIDVKVSRTEVSLIAGSVNYFCWGNCFTPEISISPNSISVLPTAFSEDFYAEYEPGAGSDFSEIRYDFYQATNAKNSVSVYARYSNDGTSIRLPETGDYFSIYSDKGSLSAEYSLTSDKTLIISDLSGRIIVKSIIQAGKTTISLPYSISSGIYVYSLADRTGQRVSGKFVKK
jgi:hypothetical protein